MTDAIDKTYRGLVLSDDEKRLLTEGPGRREPALDKQRLYVLRFALTPLECPACQGLTCQRAAAQIQDGETFFDGGVPKEYACHLCKAKLTHNIGLIGGEQWFRLVPGQVIAVGEGPVDPPKPQGEEKHEPARPARA